MVILRAGQEVFGMSTGRNPTGDKYTWWWNDEAKDTTRANNKLETSGREEERENYRHARRQRKK